MNSTDTVVDQIEVLVDGVSVGQPAAGTSPTGNLVVEHSTAGDEIDEIVDIHGLVFGSSVQAFSAITSERVII